MSYWICDDGGVLNWRLLYECHKHSPQPMCEVHTATMKAVEEAATWKPKVTPQPTHADWCWLFQHMSIAADNTAKGLGVSLYYHRDMIGAFNRLAANARLEAVKAENGGDSMSLAV